MNRAARAVSWVEQGLVPDRVVRRGIRRRLAERLVEVRADDAAGSAALAQAFIEAMRRAPIVLAPGPGGEPPAAFFAEVLGPHRKYSGCFWGEGVHELPGAEAAALALTCERAGLADGQDVLELGCGWGALSLWMAERFPNSHVTALSDSHAQREHVEAQAAARGLVNLHVVTRDMDGFDTASRFDRIVSVEMFEHLRNWPHAFARVAKWLHYDGRFFLHVRAHRGAPYAIVERDAGDWMSRHFFAGAMMPSDDLAPTFQDDLRLLRRWRWDGTHYQRTAEAWLRNLDERREAVMPLLAQAHGGDAALWWQRWRLFLMSTAEQFGHARGQQWWVGHYLFAKRA